MEADGTHGQAQSAFGAPAAARTRPSVAGFWLGGALIGVGILGAFAWFIAGLVGFSQAIDDLHRVPLPGVAEVRLSEGRQAVYYERRGAESTTGDDAEPPPPRVSVRIVPAAGGPALRVGPHGGTVSYSTDAHHGRSVAGFDVPRTGVYRVTAGVIDERAAGGTLAIGHGIGRRLVRSIVGAIVIFLLGGVGGTILVIVTHQRRQAAPTP